MTTETEQHDSTDDRPAGTARSNGPAWVCGLVLGLSMFAVNYSLAIKLDRLKVFEQPNLLFHADPMWRVQSFSTGYGWSDRNLVHPNLGNYFSIPNRVVCKLVVLSRIYDGDEKRLRRSLALLLVPVLSAATVSIVFLFLYRSGLSIVQAMLVALIGGCSFSQLIFGSIPDHFAISGFCLAVGCWLAIEYVRTNGRIYWIPWIGLGILAVGITITNIVWLGLLFSVPQIFVRRDWTGVVKNSVMWSIAVVTLTFCVAEIGKRVYERKSASWAFREAKRYQEDYSEEGVLKLAKAPAVVANTFSPPRLERIPNKAALDLGVGRKYMFTLEHSSAASPNLIAMLLLVAGTVGWLSERGEMRAVAVAGFLILALNLVMHAIWSVEYFVFSQHWLVPTLVLIGGIFRFGPRYNLLATLALSVIAVLMLWHNVFVLAEIFSTLSADAPAEALTI